jgi:hypothetical protein
MAGSGSPRSLSAPTWSPFQLRHTITLSPEASRGCEGRRAAPDWDGIGAVLGAAKASTGALCQLLRNFLSSYDELVKPFDVNVGRSLNDVIEDRQPVVVSDELSEPFADIV